MPDYHTIKEQIEDGDILLFRGQVSLFNPWTWFSFLIRIWTTSQFTHVAVASWGNFAGRSELFCFEAMEGTGVRVVSVESYLKQGCRIDWHPLIDERVDREKVIDWFRQRLGSRYASPWQLWRSFTLLPLMEWCKLPTLTDTDRYFCSMAAGFALEAGGFDGHIQLGKRPEMLSPGDFTRLPGLRPAGQITFKGTSK